MAGLCAQGGLELREVGASQAVEKETQYRKLGQGGWLGLQGEVDRSRGGMGDLLALVSKLWEGEGVRFELRT